MDQKHLLKVGLIGCGRIASLWDEGLSSEALKSSFPKTHALAYAQNSLTKITALCDIDLSRAKKAADYWGVNFFTDQLNDFLNQPLDIISICTPPEGRAGIIEKISAKLPHCQLIIEKPLSRNLSEALALKNIADRFTKPPLVNYSRRFTPGIQQMRNQIKSGEWGSLQAGTAYYGNGYMNNGSHMLDLICYLMGEPLSSKELSQTNDDRLQDDYTSSSTLIMPGNANIQIHGIDHRQYTVFELDLLFNKGRIRFTERASLVQTQKIIDDPVYEGFKILGEAHTRSTQYERSLQNAIDEAVSLHTKKIETPSCTVEDAIAITRLIESTRRK